MFSVFLSFYNIKEFQFFLYNIFGIRSDTSEYEPTIIN